MLKRVDFHYIKDNSFSSDQALKLEWLDTNGLGGYSSSTAINCNTRKYHGLLVCNLEDPYPPGKYVLLSKMEETIVHDGKEFNLTSTQYPNHFQNSGFSLLKEFVCDTHPCFIYQLDDIVIIKEVLLLHQENILLIKYKILSEHKKPSLTLNIRPLLAYRNFHSLTKENSFIQSDTINCKWGRRIFTYENMPPLFIQMNEYHDFKSSPLWYRNFEYLEEQKRGFDYTEDLFSPGVFTLPFAKEIILSYAIKEVEDPFEPKWETEITRRQNIVIKSPGDNLQKQLNFVGQSFIQYNSIKKLPESIIAGYHWFNSWGRDTMISLPGLTLYASKKEYDIALNILKHFAAEERDGLLPNFLGKNPADNAYNTVDASLWFIWALQQYYLKTNNLEIISKYFWSTLLSIFSNYKNGTLYGIKMLDNGILVAGDRLTNVTWMDAMVNGEPVTPRPGAQVEVNALWYNALNFILALAKLLKDPIAKTLKPIVDSLKTAFNTTFWKEDIGYLCDFVNENEHNIAIRPNQIFAVSLPYSPLSKENATKVVNIVKEHLLTMYGLRTLSPKDPNYIGCYAGNADERDKAYHNGTVWPWLLGHFTEALKKTTSTTQLQNTIKPCLAALAKHLHEAGIGTISEVFSGNHPYDPNGCISQAWSIAEVLRAIYLINE